MDESRAGHALLADLLSVNRLGRAVAGYAACLERYALGSDAETVAWTALRQARAAMSGALATTFASAHADRGGHLIEAVGCEQSAWEDLAMASAEPELGSALVSALALRYGVTLMALRDAVET